MQKEEIIQLHTLFAQIKNELEQQFSSPASAFGEYEELNVLPHHVHKSKDDHKRAVFVLGKVIANEHTVTASHLLWLKIVIPKI